MLAMRNHTMIFNTEKNGPCKWITINIISSFGGVLYIVINFYPKPQAATLIFVLIYRICYIYI